MPAGTGARRASGRRNGRRSWLGLLVPALLAFAVLIGLGIWQIAAQGLEGRVDRLADRASSPRRRGACRRPQPGRSSIRPTTNIAASPSRARIRSRQAKRWSLPPRPDSAPMSSGPGYWVFTPARLADRQHRDGQSRLRARRPAGPEVAARRPGLRAGRDHGRDALAGYAGIGSRPTTIPRIICGSRAIRRRSRPPRGIGPVAPFYVEQETPVPPGGLPQPGKLVVSLPDNHLQYALTWFGLAAVLAGVFIAWAFTSGRRQRRRHRRSAAPIGPLASGGLVGLPWRSS